MVIDPLATAACSFKQARFYAGIFSKPGLQFVIIDVQLFRRQYWSFYVMTTRIVAFFKLLNKVFTGDIGRIQLQQGSIIRQIVKQRAGIFTEQRQVILDTCRCITLADLAVDAAVL